MHKPLSLLRFSGLGALALALSVGAAHASEPAPDGRGAARAAPAKGKGAPKGLHTPPAPNPYVVGDPDDPRVLRPAPGFHERGFDRGWVEKMTRPRIPTAVLDMIEQATPAAPRAVPLTQPGSAAEGFQSPLAAVQQGSVLVVEGNNNLVVNTQNGLGFNHNNGMFDVINEVLATMGDKYDFITVWTTFPDFNVAAYYFPIRQDVEGLGECNFNAGRTFGCLFDQTDDGSGNGLRLQGIVFMNSVSTWQEWDRNYDGVSHPIDSFDSAIYSTLGQEVAHRWGSGLRFVDPRTGSVSNKLLGRDFSHWAAYVDTDASVMDGWDWETNGDKFLLVNDMDIFSTLDLYTMGALPVAAAQPFFFIDGAQYTDSGQIGINGRNIGGGDVLQLGLPSVSLMQEFGVELGATGERVDLTIQDVVNAEGNRCPDPDNTQKAFTQAMVLVTRPGQSAAAASSAATEIEVINETWEKWWADRTGRALTLCTNLEGECEQASATLGGGTLDTPAADGDLIEPGDDITLHLDAIASGAAVKNARVLLKVSGAGADFAELKEPEIALGDIAEGDKLDVAVEIAIDEAMPCGSPTIVTATIKSDNAPDVIEQYRLFPGYDQVFLETFGKADDFETDNDGAESGDLERIDVALSCDITPRTPERDASPANAGAYVTGATDELVGDAELLSPVIDLRGTIKPQLRFNYWLDGEGFLLVEASKDGGETFVDAVKYEDPAHEWQLGFVDITDLFGGTPDELVLRFKFDSRDGTLEGGVDEVRVLARAGQCAGFLGLGCAATDGASTAPFAALLGLLALVRVRRKRS